ncbi:MAG TPA: response regulator transcription factor [Candidatus Dormibacteraeota bacterium]|jgi:DNA-binding response OmpR family regulator|nr:response regulator transcription factor [Candidatus Dormibacteraeota bacterium]
MQHSSNGSRTVLVIDADPERRAVIRRVAGRRGLVTREVTTHADAVGGLQSRTPDLIILDADLADGRGLCGYLRAEELRAPILLLVADAFDLRVGLRLDAGADDVLVKPIDPEALSERLDAHLERDVRTWTGAGPLQFDDLTLDVSDQRVYERGVEVPLSRTEFDLLAVLASRPGQVFSSGELLQRIWGYQGEDAVHVLRAGIGRLQKLIEDHPERPRRVQVVSPLGYRFSG